MLLKTLVTRLDLWIEHGTYFTSHLSANPSTQLSLTSQAYDYRCCFFDQTHEIYSWATRGRKLFILGHDLKNFCLVLINPIPPPNTHRSCFKSSVTIGWWMCGWASPKFVNLGKLSPLLIRHMLAWAGGRFASPSRPEAGRRDAPACASSNTWESRPYTLPGSTTGPTIDRGKANQHQYGEHGRTVPLTHLSHSSMRGKETSFPHPHTHTHICLGQVGGEALRS